MGNSNDLVALKRILKNFAEKRNWDQFHTPKNLSMALIVEAAELVEHFQWLTPEESNNLPDDKVEKVKEEAADILIYLARLSDILGFDLLQAAFEKIQKNDGKYPEELVSGKALKYTEY
jgi:NTP pyrophosphatase (non-canonical NTP hydrolase)